ncbi:MAG: hypothetical protein C0483_21045 [Pirellula sp.]|nr:hypothetical protein [Pirellula sp.]
MLAVQPPSRTFGGNFGRAVDGDEAEKSPDVSRHVKIPSSEFRPLIPRFVEPPEYREVSRALLSTFQVAAKSEVAELMFEVP